MKRYVGFALLVMSFPLAADTLVLNGGDSIYCQASVYDRKFPMSGLYVLDYALNFPLNLREVVQPKSLNYSLDRIQELLNYHQPDAALSFAQFRVSLPIVGQNTTEHVWRPVKKELREVHDEGVSFVPANCREKGSGKTMRYRFQQTVVRYRTPKQIVYDYDFDVVQRYLSQRDPLQASVLFVHEWLWQFYENEYDGAAKIREANAFLHSRIADFASTGEFRARVFAVN